MPPPERTTKEKLRHLLLKAFAQKYGLRKRRPDSPPRKVLLIRPDHVGDLLLATPSIRRLRRELGGDSNGVRLVGMVGPWGKAVWRNNEFLDDLITCRFPGFERAPKRNPIAPYVLLFRCASSLRKRDFDTAVVMRFDHWWGAWLAAESGIPHRIGFDVPDVAPFLTDPVPYTPDLHEAEQNWRLLQELLPADRKDGSRLADRLYFSPEPGSAARAEKLLQESGIEPSRDRFIVIHPGSGAPVKRWEPRKWAAVARVAYQRGYKVVLTGGPGEESLTAEIAADCDFPVADLAGRTSLDVLAEVLKRARLVMGPDSGILHLASSQGTPTLGLYGPADPKLFGPWPPGSGKVVMSHWDCAPCGRLDFPESELENHRCVRDIPLEEVIAEMKTLLE